jgi:excisionase family DNA binding protein
MKTYYTVKDAAETLQMSVRQVREYIKQGRLEASKVGRAYLISEENLRQFVESCRSA